MDDTQRVTQKRYPRLMVYSLVAAVGCVAAFVAGWLAMRRGTVVSLFIIGAGCAGTALVLGHAQWRKSGRSGIGLLPLAIGYAYFIAAAIDFGGGFHLEPLAVLLIIESARLFVWEYPRRSPVAVSFAVVLAAVSFSSLTPNQYVFPGKFLAVNWGIGVFGLVLLALLPGWALFRPSVSTRGKTFVGAFIYLLAVAVAWQAWRGFEGLQKQQYVRDWAYTTGVMEGLAQMLNAYQVDNSSYPPAVDISGAVIPGGTGSDSVSSGYVPSALLGVIGTPLDLFSAKANPGRVPFRYATNGDSCWILASDGPDGDIDIEVADYPNPAGGNCDMETFRSLYGIGNTIEYDASNGTESNGDIVRFGPQRKR